MKLLVTVLVFVAVLSGIFSASANAVVPPSTYARQSGSWNTLTTWMYRNNNPIVTSTDTNRVDGISTYFLSDLTVGDTLLTKHGVIIGVVASIQSNTVLHLTDKALVNLASEQYYRNVIAPPDESSTVIIGNDVTITLPSGGARCASMYLGTSFGAGGSGRIVFSSQADTLRIGGGLQWGVDGIEADSGVIDMSAGGVLYLDDPSWIQAAANARLYPGQGTVVVNVRTFGVSIPGLTYYNFVKDGSQTAWLADTMTVQNTVTLRQGEIDNSSYPLSVEDGGTVVRENGSVRIAMDVLWYTLIYTGGPYAAGGELPGVYGLMNLTIGDYDVTLSNSIWFLDTLRFAGEGNLITGPHSISAGPVSSALPKHAPRAPDEVTRKYYPVIIGAGKGHCVVTSVPYSYLFVQLFDGARFVFEIGADDTSYNPVIVKNNTSGELTASARVQNIIDPPTSNDAASVQRMWDFDYYNGDTGVVVSFVWDRGEAGGAIDPATTTLWQHDGGTWVDLGRVSTLRSDSTTQYDTTTITGLSHPFPNTKFTVGNTGALPAELISFHGMEAAAGTVNLSWTTLSEQNTLGFYIERRGQHEAAYRVVSELIAGYGSTLEQHDYSWTDQQAGSGTWHYRVKQVDLDNHCSYSPVVTIVVAGALGVEEGGAVPAVFALHQNYPNPFNPATVIGYDLPEEAHVSLKVYTLLGDEVATLVNERQGPGYRSVSLDCSSLASGIYVYRIRAGMHALSRRMMVIK